MNDELTASCAPARPIHRDARRQRVTGSPGAVLRGCRRIQVRSLVLVSVAMVMSGCTMAWVRPNTTAEQTHDDSADCNIRAYGKYPERMVRIDSTSRNQPSRDEDTNSTLRDEEAKYCMRQKGYTYQMGR